MRVKGIKIVTVKRGGKAYRYYRHRATNILIKAPCGTAAFAAEAAALDARAKSKEPLPGTWGALVEAYRKAPEFTQRAVRTRRDYERVFDYLESLRDMPLRTISPAQVYEFRDDAFTLRKRRFATYVVQVIRLVLEWGRKREYVERNVAWEIESVQRPRDMPKANRAWADSEREAVLTAASSELKAVIALGMFVGLREGDAVRLPKSAYDGEWIRTIAEKNGELVALPAHFRLREILSASAAVEKERARKRKVVALDTPTLAVNRWGQPWTQSGFRASFFKLIRKLVKEKKVQPGLTFHGLRHTNGKLIIEAGGSVKDVGVVLADKSSAMGEHYSREFDKGARAKATMKKLERIERAKMDKRADKSGQQPKRISGRKLKG